MKKMKSRICWLTKEAGGREEPPTGPRYSTVARFAERRDQWPHEAWSLVIEFIEAPDDSLCTVAMVGLLNPDGPTELLHHGSAFELFEGYRLVARGEIL
jgi:hypothetical protein